MSKLTAAERNKLGSGQFAIPRKRAYPIHDINHARDALARASGKSVEPQVKAAVHKKYPQLADKEDAADAKMPGDAKEDAGGK